MKNRTDLAIDDVVYISVIYNGTDSSLHLWLRCFFLFFFFHDVTVENVQFVPASQWDTGERYWLNCYITGIRIILLFYASCVQNYAKQIYVQESQNPDFATFLVRHFITQSFFLL